MEQVEAEIDMSVELLNTLSLAAYIIAGVFLLVAVALFFLLDVPKLIGDISGFSAKKAIKAIRQKNENSGEKAYKPSPVNVARGKTTDEISPSGKPQRKTSGTDGGVQTGKLSTAELLKAAQKTAFSNTGNETTPLNQGQSGIATLTAGAESGTVQRRTSDVTQVTVDVEMEFIGSSELIE
jgi:hypothetical protein